MVGMVNKNYKRLGDYIQRLNNRNQDLVTTELLGINIDKYFMPSVANIIGTDLSRYKLVEKNQFACNRMHVGRDDRIPIALSKREDSFIVSPAYDVFEITKPQELSHEYLMMWVSRKEFDREVTFYTDADVRAGLKWESLEDIRLPIPSIEKQREIVAEYQSIENKIKVNEQICEKLEEAAQALYRHWFVDFEFPNEEGLPYKSSGGEMVWNEEMEKEVPRGWGMGFLSDFALIRNGRVKPSNIGHIPVYGGNGIIDNVSISNYENVNIIGRVGAYCGSVYYNTGKVWVTDNALASDSKNNTIYHDFLLLSSLSLNSKSEGSSHPLLTQKILNGIPVVKSNDNYIYSQFEYIVKSIFNMITEIRLQNEKLTQLQNLSLLKM